MKEELKQRMSQEDLNVLGNLQKSYDDNTDFNSDMGQGLYNFRN